MCTDVLLFVRRDFPTMLLPQSESARVTICDNLITSDEVRLRLVRSDDRHSGGNAGRPDQASGGTVTSILLIKTKDWNLYFNGLGILVLSIRSIKVDLSGDEYKKAVFRIPFF